MRECREKWREEKLWSEYIVREKNLRINKKKKDKYKKAKERNKK